MEFLNQLSENNLLFLAILGCTILALSLTYFFFRNSILKNLHTRKRKKTQSSSVIGSIAEVHLTIRANRSSIGEVHVRKFNRKIVLKAITDDSENLYYGTLVIIWSITKRGILLVKKA